MSVHPVSNEQARLASRADLVGDGRSSRSSAFVAGRWSIFVAIVLTIGAALRYPGGTFHDPSTRGYSLSENFLSDLGMTVAHDGQPNRLGALLFVLSLCIVVLGLGRALLEFIRICSASPSSRRVARMAGGVGLVVCLSFVGVAVTPENRLMDLHLQLTLLAFRAFPLLTLLLAVASLRSTVFPKRVALGWALLTIVLAVYVVVLTWGPNVATASGLTTQVIAQKTVAIAAMSFFFYLCVEADRDRYSNTLRKDRA